MGFSKDNLKGIVLAFISCGFIGASFFIKKKKKSLKKAAAASSVRAGCVGGYSYLVEPLWWFGMITCICSCSACLGALSIIISAVLALFLLKERLHWLGRLGCVMCIVGSIIIVIHTPYKQPISSVQEIWTMATQPAFLLYVGSVDSDHLVSSSILHLNVATQINVLGFTGICLLMGSLSVMSVKALGTSLKLTIEGYNQLIYPKTWFFVFVVAICVTTEMNYLNKALNTTETAIVSPIYYVMFTTLTIVASIIMFKASTFASTSCKRASQGNFLRPILFESSSSQKNNFQKLFNMFKNSTAPNEGRQAGIDGRLAYSKLN